jgi:hypothetical protein
MNFDVSTVNLSLFPTWILMVPPWILMQQVGKRKKERDQVWRRMLGLAYRHTKLKLFGLGPSNPQPPPFPPSCLCLIITQQDQKRIVLHNIMPAYATIYGDLYPRHPMTRNGSPVIFCFVPTNFVVFWPLKKTELEIFENLEILGGGGKKI